MLLIIIIKLLLVVKINKPFVSLSKTVSHSSFLVLIIKIFLKNNNYIQTHSHRSCSLYAGTTNVRYNEGVSDIEGNGNFFLSFCWGSVNDFSDSALLRSGCRDEVKYRNT